VTDPRLLVVLAHPALERSRANRAMQVAVECTPPARLHDLYEAYPDFLLDVAAEQERLLAHDTVVLQFPLYWYSCPALLKEWLDLVWLHGFAYGETGRALRGKTLAVACSTGARETSYGPFGHNRYGVEDFLRPFEATAHLCGMAWAEPFVAHGAALLGDAELKHVVKGYQTWLRALPGGARAEAA
jgi:glutathione-regulated potassium-efflux system ancillary protein KefG